MLGSAAVQSPAAARSEDSRTALSERLAAATSACVRCGLCQPHCPTYAVDRNEAESPRGRITLAAALAGNEAGIEAALEPLDHCLGCRRCESVCPAGVQFDALLVDARALALARRPLPWRQRLLGWAVARRWPLALGLKSAGLLRAIGALRGWPRSSGSAPRSGLHAATGRRRGRVLLFRGCVAAHVEGDLQRAAVDVLNRLGWEVEVADGAHCCGALHRHAGQLAEAEDVARATRTSMDAPVADCDMLLVTAPGCHADLVRTLGPAGAKVHELTAFIADDAALDALALRRSDAHVLIHVPCTQTTAVRRGDVAAALLARIPGLVVQSLPDRGCCGAAGSHMLAFPARAAALRAPLLDAVATAAPDILCSGNVGCRLHLADGLAGSAGAPRLLHPIEVLAEHLA